MSYISTVDSDRNEMSTRSSNRASIPGTIVRVWKFDNKKMLINNFQIKTPSQDTLAKSLSGGNIQKVVVARELSREPRVIVAAQPTRGLDVGATEYVRERLLEERKAGTAVMLISEDLDEIFALADRIAVIYEGQIMGILQREEATPEKLGLLMAGVSEGDK